MEARPRERDAEAERRERDSFIVLQHLYTLEEAFEGLPVKRVAEDLGLVYRDAEEIVEHLLAGGYLESPQGSACIRTSPRGVEYIERLAWRRRSLRV